MKRGYGSLVKRGKVYYYRFKQNGAYTMQRVIDDTTGERITDKEKAKSIVEKLIQEQIKINNIESKAEVLIKVAETKKLLTRCKILVSDLENAFFDNHKQELSIASTVKYREYIRRFTTYINNTLYLSDITPTIAKQFLNDYYKTGVSNRTYNYCLLTLSIAFRLFLKDENPFKDISKKKLETEERLSFSIEQLESIWKTLKSDYYMLHKEEMITLYIIALNTGLRCGDCCLLEWKSIDLDKRIIEIIPSKVKQSSRKKVIIPLNDTLYNHLIGLKNEGQGVLLPSVSKRYENNPCGIAVDTSKLLEASGITTKTEPETTRKQKVVRYSFHSFRHTFASLLIDSGASQTVVSRLLGHTTLTMTNRYVHINDAKKLEVVNLLPSNPVRCENRTNKEKEEVLFSYLQTVLNTTQMEFVKTLMR